MGSAHAVEIDAHTLEDALVGADVFLGLSSGGVMTKEMVKKMAARPIIFAMANPVQKFGQMKPKVRPDAIIATGQTFQIKSITSLAFHIFSVVP